ncbi:FAD-dependent oxidoreductase [Crocosphaera chwakensis]|uniref:FAD-dependent pyridine nucleotide-disulphide oxidoreductase n=1 Tax=Crocosphaera chwakensis CCY0110 TaxID=391612 RepID=A3IVB3_9CHRO|nr:FAD-dependent oxidoreductase [Crocosphaera chwakensis]EAZ89582.1 FAD-dependent pyridine nucleotide-disulphide oxidoreductase [Crocosphaera chwakensis CCY0110]
MKEIAIAHINDLENGQMQQIAVNDTQILLSKINDKFYATGAFCPHSGAPLEKGILSEERIVCPWHNACFNAIAGQQEEPPGLDSLFVYVTRVEGEEVFVQLPDETSHHRTLEMAQYVPNVDNRTFVILGAGTAGINAVETLRQEGFQGKVILISAEEILPYDRTQLSKKYLQGKTRENALSLRSQEFYAQHDIELKLGKIVTKVNPLKKMLTFDDNSCLEYDSLLLATGGKAKKLNVAGSNLANIFTLRQLEDVNFILETAKDVKNVLIIGSSFIGMEAAASLTQQGLNVTVVSPNDVPFKKILGDKLGKMFQKLHETNGVTFKLGTKAVEFNGEKKVESAKLENGETIPTDLVIVGIGVVPNTDYLTDSDLKAEDNSIAVNQYLQTNIEDIYAAGDIALFPYLPMEKSTRIEHWRLAAQHGRIAAKNMLGHNQLQDVSEIVPFFWSGQYNLKLRYVGHAEQWDEIAIDGDLDQPEFLAFYLQNNKIMAVAGVNRDQDIAAISESMRQQKMTDATTVKTQKINWIQRV